MNTSEQKYIGVVAADRSRQQQENIRASSLLDALPAPTQTPEIQREVNRLHNSVERVQMLFGALAIRLNSVRGEDTENEATKAMPDTSTQTTLGGQIRAATNVIDTLNSNIEYHLRTVALTD